LWYRKTRTGGIIAGHDYILDGMYSFGEFGVQKAVQEFVEAEKIHLSISAEPAPIMASWFAVKKR